MNVPFISHNLITGLSLRLSLLKMNGRIIQYDSIAVNTIVANRVGEVSSCDVPFSDNLQQFNADYLRLTKQVAESCRIMT